MNGMTVWWFTQTRYNETEKRYYPIQKAGYDLSDKVYAYDEYLIEVSM